MPNLTEFRRVSPFRCVGVPGASELAADSRLAIAALLVFFSALPLGSNPANGQVLAPFLNSPQRESDESTESKLDAKPKAEAATSGEDDKPVVAAPADTGAVFKTLASRVEQSQLSDEDKAATLATIAQGESQLAEIQTQQKLVDERTDTLSIVPQRAKKLTEKLSELTKFKPALPEDQTLPNLEVQLANADAELVIAKKAASDAETAMARATGRHREIETELPALQEKLTTLTVKDEASDAEKAASLLAQAKRAETQVAVKLVTARIAALNAEAALLAAEVAANMPQLRRDVAVRQSENLQAQNDLIKTAVEKKRAVEAAKRVESANEQLATLHPALQPIGEKNKKLAKDSQTLAKDIEAVRLLLEERTLKLEQLESSLKQAETRVDTVGLTDAVGAMLRNLKQGLPSAGEFHLRAAERQTLINDTQYELFELTDLRNKRLELMVDQIFATANPPMSLQQRADLSGEAKELLQQQRADFLDPAIRTQTNYFNALVSLSTVEQQILKTVESIRLYVDERVLWVRSTKPLTSQLSQWFQNREPEASQLMPSSDEGWFLHSAAWDGAWQRLFDEVKRRFFLWLASVVALIALLRLRVSLRKEIADLGHQVSQAGYTRFGPTMKTILLTVLTAAPLFLIFAFLSWRLHAVAGGITGMNALSRAAFAFALGYFPAEILRQICRPKGLAESHFALPSNKVAIVRRNMRLILFIVIPLLTAASFLDTSGLAFGRDTLTRCFFIAAMIALALIVARLFNPQHGVFSQFIRSRPTGWAARLVFVWYPLLIGLPVALAILALVGYYFTSQQLGWRLYRSTVALSILSVVSLLVLRWAMLRRRQLKIDELRQRRAAAAESAANSDAPPELLDENSIDLSSQVQQTRQILQTAMIVFGLAWLWVVWKDVVPALGLFDRWPLWESTKTISEIVPTDDGGSITRTRDVPEKITIADVGFSLLSFGLMIVAIRDLPGLLDFAVLRRLPFDRSTRYAITSLTTYLIAMLGLIVCCYGIGLRWNQIQWMATALTFGLAFGLQEMFANFIAGIIILFEQPIRVGDVVEIDGVTGVVSRIRIRATTITSWDRKDYIVPNKEFITGKLLNWTRSDEIARLTLEVGIAYGANTNLARDLLLKAANDHTEVLSEPPPIASFEQFGDNSLNYKLRVYIKSYEKRFHVSHDLHTAVNDLFAEAKIEISFPQRDLHLRTVPEPMLKQIVEHAASVAKPDVAKD
ncbi:mechanosensitive ion channel domain-containing protein [Stieleria marina]|uniref:mechanosensitive ion channel domain-containing protein n=1 Tax=Stieleria marina TaxID=1930275 RepID=UPI003AF3A0F4